MYIFPGLYSTHPSPHDNITDPEVEGHPGQDEPLGGDARLQEPAYVPGAVDPR